MTSKELFERVKRVEIKAKGLVNSAFAGRYHSAFKGRGMAFSEVRAYQAGDDVRDIDWNVTARHDAPYVKLYEEERELTLMLAVDMSRSLDFGTIGETKRELVAEIAATLAFSAMENSDKVGVALYTDRVEKYIPPAKGRRHILYIIRELLSFRAEGKGTNTEAALDFLNGVLKKRATLFLMGDFIADELSETYRKRLMLTSLRHDLMAIEVSDRREADLTPMGLVQFEDLETGRTAWVNTSCRKVREAYHKQFTEARDRHAAMLRRMGIDYTEVSCGEDFALPLMRLFAKR